MSFAIGELVWSAEDKAEVTVREIATRDRLAYVLHSREGTRFWRSLSTLTPLEPKVGDRIRITELTEGSSFFGLGVKVGDELTFANAYPSVVAIGFQNTFVAEHPKDGAWAKFVLLSRAPSNPSDAGQAVPVQPSEAEGCSALAPRTLPAGTQFRIIPGGSLYEFIEQAVLKSDGWHGRAVVLPGRCEQHMVAWHEDIVLEKPERQAPPVGDGSPERDPYAEHERGLRELSGAQRLVMQNWFEIEDRRAAAREAKEQPRKVEGREPSDWDVDEAEELYVS